MADIDCERIKNLNLKADYLVDIPASRDKLGLDFEHYAGELAGRILNTDIPRYAIGIWGGKSKRKVSHFKLR